MVKRESQNDVLANDEEHIQFSNVTPSQQNQNNDSYLNINNNTPSIDQEGLGNTGKSMTNTIDHLDNIQDNSDQQLKEADSSESDTDLNNFQSLQDLDVREDLSDDEEQQNQEVQHISQKDEDDEDDEEEKMPYVPSSDSDKEDPTLTIQQENNQHLISSHRSNRSTTQRDFAIIKQNPVFLHGDASQETTNLLFSAKNQSDQGLVVQKQQQECQQPSAFDFNFPSIPDDNQDSSNVKEEEPKNVFQQIEMIKPNIDRKQSHANVGGGFDFSFPDENNDQPMQTVVLDSRMNTSPVASQSNRSFKQSVLIQSDTKSDIIKLPNEQSQKMTSPKYQSQYNKPVPPSQGPTLNTQLQNQSPFNNKYPQTQQQQLLMNPSPINNQNRNSIIGSSQQSTQNVQKKDSFMDMLGDILGNNTSQVNNQDNTRRSTVQLEYQQQQKTQSDMNLDDILDSDKQQQRSSTITPNKVTDQIQSKSNNKSSPPTMNIQQPPSTERQSKGGFDFSLFEDSKANSPPIIQSQRQQLTQPIQNNNPSNLTSSSSPIVSICGDQKATIQSPGVSQMNLNNNEPLRQSLVGVNQTPNQNTPINHQQFSTHSPQLTHPQNMTPHNQFSSGPLINNASQPQQFMTHTPIQQQHSMPTQNSLQAPIWSQQYQQQLLSPFQQQQVPFTPARFQTPQHMTNSPNPQQFGTPVPSQFQSSPSPHQIQQQQQNTVSPDTHDTKRSDITIDKSQFTTQNTEQLANEQKQSQNRLEPTAMIRMMLQQFFRKSLMSHNKSVLFEDANIQVGLLCDIQQGGLVRMRLFLGNKNQNQTVTNIKLITGPSQGFQMQQNRDFIQSITYGQQEPIDLVMKVTSFHLSVPLYQLQYQLNNSQQSPITIRLPIVLLKFCQSIPSLDTQTFIYKWNFECNSAHEFKQSFNVDFNQCRSLTQLKEVLQFGKQNTIQFVDNVEQQKNIVCGGTELGRILGINTSTPLFALIKITITANGQNCEIVGRSNDSESGIMMTDTSSKGGKFAQHVISNILEMIALQVQSSSQNNIQQ